MPSILVCRVAWMETYATPDEKAESNHGWVRDGHLAHECLNFLMAADGLYRGFVQVRGDSKGNPGRVAVERLGAPSIATQAEDILVVIAATHPKKGGIKIVGFYHNATVFREAQWSEADPAVFTHPRGQRMFRFSSHSATLLPQEERTFSLPRGLGGMGQNDLWYGLNDPAHTELRAQVLALAGGTMDEEPNASGNGVLLSESKLRSRHYRLERRSQVRRFIHEKGFTCEGCGLSLGDRPLEIWGASFEVHHLLPFAQLAVDEERKICAADVAVLCANCHRAIHRTEAPHDLASFKKLVGIKD